MSIPFVDLALQHEQIADEVREGFERIMGSGAFVLGPAVSEFEEAFAEFSEVRHCVGVANGTDALELALRAIGMAPGDEVILPANTFIASALAVVRAGGAPVLVDADPDYLMIDAEQVASAIGPRTKAVMAVDLFGQTPSYEDLEKITQDAQIYIVEDAAQSQGARRAGRAAGSFGEIAGTSFYPGKNLGAYGDGGAVLTDSDALAARVRRLGNYGSEIKYDHPEVGFNSRLDSLQAVVLLAKLRRLRGWNASRREAAARYEAMLAGLSDVTCPSSVPGNEHVWHLYAIRVPRRDEVLARLGEAGIGAGVHYPTPIHLQGAFCQLGHSKGAFPVAERAADEMISLPMFPGITPSQQEEVVTVLGRALSS